MATLNKLDTKILARHFTLTVRIRRMREWSIRIWIAKQLIRLAAFIMWVNVEIEDGSPSDV